MARRNTSSELVKQSVILVDCARKSALLGEIVGKNKWEQVLVFTRTKHGANKLSDYFNKIDISASAIHGNKSQAARTKALDDFKKNKIRVLVATDIAARGIDIDALPHVVNFELPNIAEDYVHRIGRTGRAGCEGEALSLVCIDEADCLKGIEKLIKKSIPSRVVEGYEPDPTIKAQPIMQGRGGRGNSQKPRSNDSGRPKNRGDERGKSDRDQRDQRGERGQRDNKERSRSGEPKKSHAPKSDAHKTHGSKPQPQKAHPHPRGKRAPHN